MKKIIIFFIIGIAILGMFCYIYNDKKSDLNSRRAKNNYYEKVYEKEITTNQLLSIINKTVNEKQTTNYIKDQSGKYIDNSENQVKITIKFKDIDEDINAEQIYKNDNNKFKELYNKVTFKCTKIEYNQKTKLVNYVHFEEI